MNTMTFKEREAMMVELKRIAELNETVESNGAIIDLPAGGFVSGNPTYFTSDINRAFRFKNMAAAQAFIDKFNMAYLTDAIAREI